MRRQFSCIHISCSRPVFQPFGSPTPPPYARQSLLYVQQLLQSGDKHNLHAGISSDVCIMDHSADSIAANTPRASGPWRRSTVVYVLQSFEDRCRRCAQIYRYAVRIIPKVFAAFGLDVSTCGLWLSPRTNEAFSWRLFISLSEPQALMRSHVPIRSPRSLAISALSGFSDDATSFLANLPLQMSSSKVAGVCSRIPMKAPILRTGLHTNAFIRSALAPSMPPITYICMHTQ